MTLQEAQALSIERQANLNYRRRIQRIKNTLLGIIAGGSIGGIAGGAKDLSEYMNKNKFERMIDKEPNSHRAQLGALIGSLTGGLGGYGLTRLKELRDDSARTYPVPIQLSEIQQPVQ